MPRILLGYAMMVNDTAFREKLAAQTPAEIPLTPIDRLEGAWHAPAFAGSRHKASGAQNSRAT